jgi:hypothetical protein
MSTTDDKIASALAKTAESVTAAAGAVTAACELLKQYAKDVSELALSQRTTFDECMAALDEPTSKEEEDSERAVILGDDSK